MKKINLVELLKDCPKGMELDCTIYNNLYFDEIVEDTKYPITCYMTYEGIKTGVYFTEYGTFNTHGNSKCVIFPKGKTTWEGFKPTNIKYEVTYGFGKDLTVEAFNEEEFKHFIDIAVCNNKDVKDFTVNIIIPD